MKTNRVIAILVITLLFNNCAWQTTVNKDPEADDYQIYSALVNGDTSPNSGKAKSLNIIDKTVLEAPLESWSEEQSASRTEPLPPLWKSARNDLEKKNKTKVAIQNKFTLNEPYILISPEERQALFDDALKGWDNFYQKYPQAQGIRAFSRIGYSADKTTAFLYSTFSCGGRCGNGSYYIFTKKDGNWKLTKMLGGVVF